jgi:hypothetical protein
MNLMVRPAENIDDLRKNAHNPILRIPAARGSTVEGEGIGGFRNRFDHSGKRHFTYDVRHRTQP